MILDVRGILDIEREAILRARLALEPLSLVDRDVVLDIVRAAVKETSVAVEDLCSAKISEFYAREQRAAEAKRRNAILRYRDRRDP